MFKLTTRMKKIITIGVAAFGINLAIVLPASAQSEKLLALIALFTYKTAEATYYVEKFTYGILTILNSWILPDNSDTTASLQSAFATVTNTALQNSTTQSTVQQQLTQDFLSSINIATVRSEERR